MVKWLGFDISQGSTKRGITVAIAAIAVWLFVPVEAREQALLGLIGGHGILGSILRD